MSDVAVLNRPLYALSEAARLLDVKSVTLRRWLEGFTGARGVEYPAVIRPEATGSTDVTWAEFVEAGYLREYRVSKSVSLQKLRRFIDLGRWSWDVPYPLAHFTPYVDRSRRDLYVLLRDLQVQAGLDESLQLVLVNPQTGQLTIREAFRSFLDKVTFSEADGVATSVHPLGSTVPVVIDPDVSFGIPQVHGIRTEALAEAYATGEQVPAIAQTYGLEPTDVEAALRWELRRARSDAA